MDGPTKKTPPAAAAEGGASSIPQDPSVRDLSPDEYMAQIRAHLDGSKPSAVPRQAADGTAVTPTPTPAPTDQAQGFWHRLLHSAKLFATPPGVDPEADKQSHDMAMAVGRGAVNAANELGHTMLEFGSFIDRKTGLGEAMQPGYNAAYDEAGGARGLVASAGDEANVVTDDEMTAAYGAKSDDPLVSLTENASQFLAGLVLARGAGIKNIYAAGAAVDATMFDPYQGQLAELAAKAPKWTGVGLVGSLLSVQNDHLDANGQLVHGDGALVARIKRSAAGAVAAGLVDGLVAGARWLRGTRVLADPAATAAQKSVAQAVVTDANKTLDQVADGSHVADGEHVIVQSTPDGGAKLAVNPQSSAANGLANESARIRQVASEARDLSLLKTRTPEQDAQLADLRKTVTDYYNGPGKLPEPVNGGGKKPLATTPTEVTAQSILDRHLNDVTPPEHTSSVTAEDILARHKAASVNDPAMAQEFLGAKAPTYASKAEAQVQAAVMNDGIDAQLTRFTGTVTDADASAVRTLAQGLKDSTNPEDIARLTDGTHFNFSYANEPKEALAYIEAISSRFQKTLDAAQGTIPIEQSMSMVKDIIGAMPEADAPTIARQMLAGQGGPAWHAKLLAADVVLKRFGSKLNDLAEVVNARPNDAIATENFRTALTNMYGLQEALASANSEWGRTGRILQERANPALKNMAFDAGAQASPEAAATAPAATPRSDLVAGMTPSELRAQARMIRMTGGDPANMFAVRAGAQVITLRSVKDIAGDLVKNAGSGSLWNEMKQKVIRSAVEVFTNSLLSGPTTHAVIAASEMSVTAFEALARIGGGLASFNGPLAREGMDQLWGNFKYLRDNIKTAAMTIDEGRSLIDPRPTVHAIGGTTGDIVRIPGTAIGVSEELSTVSNYRAIVRARSLRLAREQGLTGAALGTRVDDDLSHAFDAEGRATLPEALAQAKKPAFNGPLPPESFGKGLTDLVNNNIYSRFVIPFVKVSFNIFDYVWQATPVLNALNAQARATMLKGGEDAAVLHARSIMAGTLYGYAWHQAAAGNLSGRGPSNPQLRQQWLLTHKPYTLSGTDLFGNRYDIPYRRLDPLGMPLGLIGDLHQVLSESPDSRDAMDLATGIVASMASNLSSKSYLTGITQFADAWGSNDPNKVKRYMQDFAANMVVPNLVTDVGRQTGLDPYYHEVRTMADAILNRLPSNGLVPRYDMFGRPVLRMLDPSSLPKNPVENTLLTLDRALPPHPTTVANGLVDLTDPKLAPKGKPVPYVRLMDLIREGFNGQPGLRDQIVNLVNSDRWNNASDGSEQFPGGTRWILANAIKTAQEQRAFNIVRQEYPAVDNAFRASIRARGMSLREGQGGVSQVENLFGVQLKR